MKDHRFMYEDELSEVEKDILRPHSIQLPDGWEIPQPLWDYVDTARRLRGVGGALCLLLLQAKEPKRSIETRAISMWQALEQETK